MYVEDSQSRVCTEYGVYMYSTWSKDGQEKGQNRIWDRVEFFAQKAQP